jgi:hypothetical protein
MIEATKTLINLVFDCFLPEMHEEVISDGKQATAKKDKAVKDEGSKALLSNDDSEYV